MLHIGSTIRRIRKRKGITITQLCEGTGLSKGFMSHVENNKTSPSIATLESIAAFLEVPLAYLLLRAEERMKVVRKDERQQITCGKEELKMELLSEEGGLQLTLVEFPVGFPSESVEQSSPGEEVHYLLKGKLLAIQGEDSAILEEGDSFSWQSCAPHLIKNIGDVPAVCLIASHDQTRAKKYTTGQPS